MFLEADEFRLVFSFRSGEPLLYMTDRFLFMIPPGTGILVGEEALGEELDLPTV